jgi:arsenate reductase
MSGVKIYHNPRCRKSRETLELIRSKGVEPEIILYLEQVPSAAEIKLLLARLDMNMQDIIRKEEPFYKEKLKNLKLNDDEWITVMRENPKLMQRPIVVKGSKAIMGRPPENVLKLL